MSKKILALALAIVFVATAFTACKKGPELTEVNGKEYPLATDKDGQTVINDENQIAVLVTDRNNEVLTYENGENQTYWIDVPKEIVEGEDYSLEPGKDWVYKGLISGYGKKGQENDIILKVAEFENQYGDLDTYIEETEKASEEYIEKLKESFPDTKYTITDGVVTSKSIPCKIVELEIKDAKGEVFHYGYLAHFVYNKRIITLEYACQNYSYEKTDVLELFNKSFKFE